MKSVTTIANSIKLSILGLLMAFTFAAETQAQFSVALDYQSRYVWRGSDFGNSPSLQPGLSYTTGGLEIGAWAAYATNGNPAGSEIDFYAAYTFETEAGDFSLSVTDYTFPDVPGDYFNSDAHFVELGLAYSASVSETWSIGLSGNVFVHNDDDNAFYGEVGLDYEGEDYSLSLFSGFSPAETALYGNNTFAFINTGLSVSKELKITELFAVDVSTSLIANPNAKTAFFLFGFGFSL